MRDKERERETERGGVRWREREVVRGGNVRLPPGRDREWGLQILDAAVSERGGGRDGVRERGRQKERKTKESESVCE